MEQQNVIYMTPEEVQNVDPTTIDTVTMTTGTIIKVADQGESNEFQEENVEENVQICEHCGLPKYDSNTTENVFRAQPQGEGEAQEEGQEVEVEGEAGEEQKEVLKGPNGMPLLGDIISGGNLTNEQNNYYNNNANIKPVEPIPVQTPQIPVNPPNQPPVVQPTVPPKEYSWKTTSYSPSPKTFPTPSSNAPTNAQTYVSSPTTKIYSTTNAKTNDASSKRASKSNC